MYFEYNSVWDTFNLQFFGYVGYKLGHVLIRLSFFDTIIGYAHGVLGIRFDLLWDAFFVVLGREVRVTKIDTNRHAHQDK